jgi:hypothetical protein
MFSKQNLQDQGLLNWSATRDSNTDFSNNSRGVGGGCGFASDNFDPGQCFGKGNTALANPAIYDHGIIQGGSDALDAMTLWIFAAVRPLHQPKPTDTAAGEAVFAANCASCRGGPKWTKSEIFHRDNPQRWLRTGLHWTRRHQTCPVASGSGSAGERVLLVHLQQSHHQISRGCGDVRPQRSFGDRRQRRRQYGIWEEWVQRAVVA